MPGTIPTNEAMDMQRQGVPRNQIIESLFTQGYSQQQISDALNQTSIKLGVQGNMPNGNPTNSGMQVSAMDMESGAADEDIPVPTPAPQAAPEDVSGNYYNAPPGGQQMPTAGAYQPTVLPPSQPMIGGAYDDVQSLVEEIIDEKWRDLLSSIGDITSWKAQMTDEVEAVKQEILRVQSRFDNLQGAVIGRVEEYGTSVKDLGSDIKAMEKVFEKILEPLTSNIKELSKITEQLRKK